MVARRSLKNQLNRIGFHAWIFGRSELKELRKVLEPGESILQCAFGYYQGGSGLMVVTDGRLLLIDKRPFFLNLEEMKADVINDAVVTTNGFQATLYLRCNRRQMSFSSFSDARLKRLAEHVREMAYKEKKDLITEERIVLKKPYLDPAWRPHHTSILSRPRKTKYTSVKS